MYNYERSWVCECLLSLAFQGYLISVNHPLLFHGLGGPSRRPDYCAANLTQIPSLLAQGLLPFPWLKVTHLFYAFCCTLLHCKTEDIPYDQRQRRWELWKMKRGKAGGVIVLQPFVVVFLVRGGNPSEELEWNCSGWGYIFLSILFNEPFYPRDHTEPDRTGDLGIANGSEFFFSFNLKITQEMLNIEKLENMHDQKKRKKNTCNLTTSHKCKHFGLNSSRPLAMHKNLF